ncbi:MAG: phosphate ABC transporter permease PstA [Ammonifex sp.]|jgi:phosphate transport system permease protein|nr:MAG: phosphate ABC transporter permease PstA [Ammonifex sp.]
MNKHALDRLATVVLYVTGAVIVGILLFFLLFILGRGLPVLTPDFIFGRPSEVAAGGGVGPQLFNTFYVLGLSLLFSLPVGVGAGIYMAEYARAGRLTYVFRLATECLATVPSIVIGLFGMILFVNAFGLGFSIIGGAAALAVLNLPVLVRVTEEALRAVPRAYREAALALGATRWQTVRKVVLPSALLSLATGVTLVTGRAFGEAAVLIFTAGTSVSRYFPDLNPLAAGETLAVHLWYVNAEALVPDAPRIAAGTAALMIIIVLFFNLFLGSLTRTLQKRLGGKTV